MIDPISGPLGTLQQPLSSRVKERFRPGEKDGKPVRTAWFLKPYVVSAGWSQDACGSASKLRMLLPSIPDLEDVFLRLIDTKERAA
jgi:hypothetical protein